MSGTQFFAEKPGDEYGNTAYPKAVIEVVVVPHDDQSRPERVKFIVVAPESFRCRWPQLLPDVFAGFKEVDGPARELTRDEWRELVGWVDP